MRVLVLALLVSAGWAQAQEEKAPKVVCHGMWDKRAADDSSSGLPEHSEAIEVPKESDKAKPVSFHGFELNPQLKTGGALAGREKGAGGPPRWWELSLEINKGEDYSRTEVGKVQAKGRYNLTMKANRERVDLLCEVK
jgi:hypothetical protein